ncbi:MAG: hypothetical protein IJS01_04930 [Lentisphaeria bacterium]|nr:hypothetical protein [Lentisphaeria bacterium]
MNDNHRILLGTVTAVIVLTIPLFLLPRDGLLFTAWGFALAGVFAVAGSLYRGANRTHGEYVTTAAFPLAAAGYLSADLLLSVAVILLREQNKYAMPAGWFLFCHALLAGLFVWKLLAMDSGKEKIEEIGVKVEAATSRWRQFRQDASALAVIADAEIRKDVSAVADALRYGDPVSGEHLEEIENAIGEKLRQLADKVKAHRNADVPALCRDLLTDIKIRNEQSKSHK